jgi:Protein of unknown function (DUF4238)
VFSLPVECPPLPIGQSAPPQAGRCGYLVAVANTCSATVIGVATRSHEEPKRHHLVSRGYQNNFASAQLRIAVMDAHSGRFIEDRRTKDNFVEPAFNSFVDLDGGIVADLENEWARIERKVLNQVRRVAPGNCGQVLRGAIASLFAIHLVRSWAFREAHLRVVSELRASDIPRYEANEQMRDRFRQERAREPRPGELAQLAMAVLDEHVAANRLFVDSMVTHHNKIVAMLAPFRVQVITKDRSGAGFMLGDVPVVHANTTTGQYGFRDYLALGDANLIMGPLGRWTAVCFTADYTPNRALTTKKQLQLINAVFCRAAHREVACHPDDVREARRVLQNLDRLPPQALCA